ncbi:MAG: hypothetical protein ACFFD2_15915 [Promethearchaeota archaeon]
MLKEKKGKIETDKNTSEAKMSSVDIFKSGMTFENTIEYIESKTLDAFFGHIYRQGEWTLAEQYLINVKEWCQMLQTTANFELTFLSRDLQNKIINLSKDLEDNINLLIKTINTRDFDKANKQLEKILKVIRELYKIRE